ncbi:MAG: DUF411 domain-containing protein [Mariprofundaceae bacterium]
MHLSRIILACGLCAVMASGAAWAGESIWDKQTASDSKGKKLDITVYYSPTCGCCGSWMDHLKKHQFNVIKVPMDNMDEVKAQHGLPAGMGSCHTAVIDGYIIEGHVPAGDIKELVKNRPGNIAGLSVPKMPVGTPGMEMGHRKDPFAVMAFGKQGKSSVYKEYRDY